jgi:hypothetical protein
VPSRNSTTSIIVPRDIGIGLDLVEDEVAGVYGLVEKSSSSLKWKR